MAALYPYRTVLARNRQTIIYRASTKPITEPVIEPIGAGGARTVILKTHQDPHPPPRWLARLRHECELVRHLRGITALPRLTTAHPDGIVVDGGRHTLILQDDLATDVASLIAHGPLPIAECLIIALAVANALATIHKRRIIHRDINPSNIIYNRDTGYIGIIDLGIASRLPRQYAAPTDTNPRHLAGTLAYLAPEQSGRMNRSADLRADLYALGITLYEILTGTPPFVSDDPLELIHAHMAIQPQPPLGKRPELPPPLSDLVMRLLEKMPERRYQSCEGLAADLRLLTERWHSGSDSETLPQQTNEPPAPRTASTWGDVVLGRFDFADRLQIPERLYGRDRQLAELSRAWDRAVSGASCLCLVAGPSGLGKSALVRELRRPVAAAHGWMLSGKCDPMSKEVPYRPLAQALHDLSEQLLRAPEPELQAWRQRLSKAVAPHGGVLVSLVPSLVHLLGDIEPVRPLPAQEAKQRFFYACSRFFRACAAANRPLLLCIDDIQWVDHASLQLITVLLDAIAIKHLAIVLTYRDDEMPPTHPLSDICADLRQRPYIDVCEVKLTPLNSEHLADLIADTLLKSADDPDVDAVAQLCHRYCQGNPFIVRECLTQWYADGLIGLQRDPDSLPSWTWKLSELTNSTLSDKAASLMAKRLARLRPAVLDALAHAACVGTRVALPTAAAAMAKPISECAVLLQQATAEDLLIIDARVDSLLSLLIQADIPEESDLSLDLGSAYAFEDIEFRFRHDRIRTAAYEALPHNVRTAVHLRLAHFLRRSPQLEQSSEILFELLLHYNQVWQHIDNDDERDQIAHYNLRAANRAIESAAYQVAADYCRVGVDALGPHRWQRQHVIAMSLHRAWATSALTLKDGNTCKRVISEALAHSHGGIERARLLTIQIEHCVHIGKMDNEFLDLVRQGLTELDIALPSPQTAAQATVAIEAELGDDWVTRLLTTPIAVVEAVPPRQEALCTLLSIALMGLFFAELSLWSWGCIFSVRLIFLGISPSMAATLYMTAAMYLAMNRRHRDAYEVGQYSIKLARASMIPGATCHVVSVLAGFVLHWGQPLRELPSLYEMAMEDGRGLAQKINTTNLALSKLIQQFYAGTDLPKLEREIYEARGHGPEHHIYFYQIVSTIIEATIACLRGDTSSPTTLTWNSWDEEDFLRLPNAGRRMAEGYYWTIKAQLFQLHGHYAEAEAASVRARATLHARQQYILIPRTFYHLLSHISQIEPTPDSKPDLDRELWNQGMDDMRYWSEVAPFNCRHYTLTLDAEYTRIHGDAWQAARIYLQAIADAHEQGFLQDQGLIHERLARLWYSIDEIDYACLHLVHATKAFTSWGAHVTATALTRELGRWNTKRAAKQKAQQADQTEPMTGTLDTPTITQRLADGTHSPQGTLEQPHVSIAAQLELSTVLKASHAISGQLKLDDLTQRLLQVTLESAGAERGCLLRPHDDDWHVELEADVSPSFSARPLGSPLMHSGRHLPITAVDYVRRTNETLVLGNAAAAPQHAEDPYVVHHGLQSLLCIPISTQNRSVAMLYLENRLTTDAFSPDRVALIRILAAQAAISLENARLFRDLQDINRELEARVERRTHQLKAAQQQLLAQAHRAGRAELAIDTVHNIGNALNSVRVNASYMHELLSSPAAARYRKANDLLNAHRDNLGDFFAHDPRAGKLVDFYLRVDALWQSQHDDMVESNRDLLHNIDAIERVVQAQRAYTESEEVIESVALDLLLQDVLTMNKSAMAELGISVSFASAQAPIWVQVNSLRLRYVLLELFENARDAICANEVPDAPRRIHVTADCGTDDDGQSWAHVCISDSGCGIDSQALTRVFQHGFSQKPGHRGFGLHNAANYIKRLGGQLLLTSDGPGLGAAATILLPQHT